MCSLMKLRQLQLPGNSAHCNPKKAIMSMLGAFLKKYVVYIPCGKILAPIFRAAILNLYAFTASNRRVIAFNRGKEGVTI